MSEDLRLILQELESFVSGMPVSCARARVQDACWAIDDAIDMLEDEEESDK